MIVELNPNHPDFNPNYLLLNCLVLKFVMDDPRSKTLYNKSLKITNPSEKNILRFKIKCTAPFNYIVRPYQDSLAPQQSVDIGIRAIIGDRQISKFNLDKFQILSKQLISHQQGLLQGLFWQGAFSQRLNVQIFQPKKKPTELISTQLTDQEFEVAQKEEQCRLDFECKQFEEKIQLLQKRNKAAAKLHPKRFLIVGVVAFILGFILA